MSDECEYFILNDGNKMPAVGLGTFQGNYTYEVRTCTLKNKTWVPCFIIVPYLNVLYQALDELVATSVRSALKNGYKHFDTAPLYQVEPSVGKTIKEEIEKGNIKREDLFLTSKV